MATRSIFLSTVANLVRESSVSVSNSQHGSKPDPLTDNAANIVSAAHLGAVGMFNPLLDRFTLLGTVHVQQWDFIVTVAGVFIATTRLRNLKVNSKREAALMEIVVASLQDWNPDAVRVFEDCKALFELEFDRLTARGHDTRFVASDALGIWVIWNILGKQPQNQEEIELVRAVGALTTHNLFDWWTK